MGFVGWTGVSYTVDGVLRSHTVFVLFVFFFFFLFFFFFQAEDGIRVAQESRGLGDVYKRQIPAVNSLLNQPALPKTVGLLTFIG